MNSRKPPRVSTPETLREALYLMVHQSDVPAKVQAETLDISYSYLANACNPDLDKFDYQLRMLIPNIVRTGNFVVLDYIERQLGRVAVPVNGHRAVRPSCGDLCDTIEHDTLSIVEEMGEAAATIKKALQDHTITPQESSRARKELWDLIQAAVKVHQEL